MKILVVEDDPVAALDLSVLVERAGHRVLGPAAPRPDAVALFAAERPDLAFIDIALQDGDTGPAVAEALFAHWRTPTIFITGHMAQANRAAAVACGFISKPFAPTAIQRWIGGTTPTG